MPGKSQTTESVDENISIDRLMVLSAKGLSLQQVADSVKCSKQNVHARLKGYQDFSDFRENLDDFYEALQFRAYKCIDDAKLQKLSAYQLALVVSILEDKKRLIRGQNTARIDINSTISSIDTIRKQEQVLEAKYKLLTGKDLAKS